MQTNTAIPTEVVGVIEPVMVLFIAAPALIRAIFRLRASRAGAGAGSLAKGWNG
jgi:simple sugar transport system permease protein